MNLLATMLGASLGSAAPSGAVRACQVGYLPDETKFAMLAAEPTGPVTIRRAKDGTAVLSVVPAAARLDPDSGDTLRLVDFSAVRAPGE